MQYHLALRYAVHGISVFAKFSYGIAVLGTPPMSPSFISDAIQFKHFLWLWLEDHDVHMMNLYWKEFASLFQSARVYAVFYFIYAIFRCSDFVLLTFVSADSHITSGRDQKFVELLLISSSSRPNLLCFGFDLNRSQRTIPIYPEMDISRTAKCSVTFHCKRVMQNPSVGRKRQEQIKMKHKQLG